MLVLFSLSESINFFKAFTECASDCGIQDRHFASTGKNMLVKAMTASSKSANCFYLDNDGVVFSVSAFIYQNGLPDNVRVRLVISEEVRNIFPDVRILEEMN